MCSVPASDFSRKQSLFAFENQTRRSGDLSSEWAMYGFSIFTVAGVKNRSWNLWLTGGCFFSGSAAVGVSPLESADPGGVRRAGRYKGWVLGVPFSRGVGFRVLGGGGLGPKNRDLGHFGSPAGPSKT